ncbi:Putative flavin-containing monoamine oxidase AofH [Sulfitobacter sp. DSM 110093]|uniref:flavin monoamine oxidase family protein n=1 Tax=Sulfitobacter sp. DSM 110093 TaxID=2883127 RepID=UPI001FAE3D30|nr:FAD-dependent oxidoreductase [Sulfitobacter sp. DSM 110093]UOA30565.1 Putative flavin-containing monoamine oxidase AofH [Sulfitobacter sp. DSM 110093]
MQTDTLIVGGGLSGLALADHLARQGRDFLLIEAQDRLGGRILTKEFSGGAFDLGPAWFWPGQLRIAALAERFQIPVFEQFSTGDLVYQEQNGTVQRGRGYASMEGSYRLAGGIGRLVDALTKALDPGMIITNTRLTSVDHSADNVTAQVDQNGRAQTIKANRIVMAMPPRVIADTVTFEPALDAARMQALQNVPTWMAGQAKIVAVYDEPYWRKAGLSGDAMSQQGPMVEIHDASPRQGGPYALFGFVGVPADARAQHKDEMMRLAVMQLTAMFGPEMADPMHLVLQDWATIPDIARPQDRHPVRSHPRYGLPTNLRALSARGVIFASTETAPEFGGFLEGALEAAEHVARTLALHETMQI